MLICCSFIIYAIHSYPVPTCTRFIPDTQFHTQSIRTLNFHMPKRQFGCAPSSYVCKCLGPLNSNVSSFVFIP